MDREAKDTFELLDDIETVLGIATCPVNWPIGSGKRFQGVYDRNTKTISRFTAANNGMKEVDSVEVTIGRITQTLNNLMVCASTPFEPSITITAESAAISVR